MPYQSKTQTPFIKMYVKENYVDINHLVQENQELIIETSIKCFKGLLTEKKKKLTFYIQAICHGVEMDVEFIYSKENADDILHKIIPYYEEKQEYEKCQELLGLHQELSLLIG